MRMKKFLRRARVPVLCVLLAAVVLLCAVAAYPALCGRETAENASYSGILRVWQIDSFEGGTGSRAAFLTACARSFESENQGVKLLVTYHTAESAANAAAGGEYPDILSFGTGTDFAADAALPQAWEKFAAGLLGGEACAVPWCRGQYFLFTVEGDFSDVSGGNTVISQGKGANPAAAAYAEGLTGEYTVLDSLAAYTAFLRGEYVYMLGSQRDVYRFAARDVAVRAQPMTGFCDLWQYAAVCTREEDRADAALGFVRYLLSEEVQSSLWRIGMLSVSGSAYEQESESMYAAQQETPQKTVSAFLTSQTVELLRESAASALNGDESGAKNLEKYLLEAL